MSEEQKPTPPAQPDRPAHKRRTRGSRWRDQAALGRIGRILLIGGLFSFSCGTLFALGTWMTLKYNVQVPEVRLPDLTGMDLARAESRLKSLGLAPQVSGRLFDASTPAGKVLEHYPPVGASTKPGRPVRLVISRGPSRAVVPELAGSSLRRAQLALRAADLHVRSTSSVIDPSVPLGRVVAQNPPAGSEGYPGDGVALLLSAGPPGEAFVMPILVGWETSAAQALLRKRGVRRVTTTGQTGPSGRLVSQWPAPGSKVVPSERITLETGPITLDPRPLHPRTFDREETP